MYRLYGKRTFDLVLSATALIMLSPALVLLALLVRLKLGSPVLFRQERPGIGGRPFTMFKFRTMTDARDRNGRLLSDEARLTGFGKFLRSMSFDELPELMNVIRGDMSLVGPRPLLMKYLDLYTGEQMRRHNVRPGITGWAQAHGRNAVDWERRFALDVEYVDSLSLLMDLKIILMTLKGVMNREGINAEGHATMPEFKGAEQ